VIIRADDLGWNDVGYHDSEIAAPRLDALAADGVVLDRLYAQPSCSPTRAALMTGKAPLRLGVLSPISRNDPTGLPLSARDAAIGRWVDALDAEGMLERTTGTLGGRRESRSKGRSRWKVELWKKGFPSWKRDWPSWKGRTTGWARHGMLTRSRT
jgi:hypothetical protein